MAAQPQGQKARQNTEAAKAAQDQSSDHPTPDTPDVPEQHTSADIATSERKQAEAEKVVGREKEARQGAPVAAPLSPDTATQLTPILGHEDSSTDHVMAAAAVMTQAGVTHVKFVGEDGQDLSPDALFEDNGGVAVTTRDRIHEVFRFANARPDSYGTQLLYPKGVEVPRAEADRVLAAARAYAAARES